MAEHCAQVLPRTGRDLEARIVAGLIGIFEHLDGFPAQFNSSAKVFIHPPFLSMQFLRELPARTNFYSTTHSFQSKFVIFENSSVLLYPKAEISQEDIGKAA